MPLVPLALIIILVLVFFAIAQCGGADASPPEATATTGSTGTARPGPTTATKPPPAGVPGGDQSLVASSRDVPGVSVFPLTRTAGSLTSYDSMTATANAAPVQAVTADEGFWIGSSTTERVWVQIVRLKGESPFVVRPGQVVSFTGKFARVTDGLTRRIGLSAAEGADQLVREGWFVAAPLKSIRLGP